MKRRLTFTLLSLLILASTLTQCKKKAAAPASQAYPIMMSAVTSQNVPVYKDSFGMLVSPVSINLTAQINGQLINMPVKEGAFVKQGDLIAQIDPRIYEANLEAAQANLLRDQASLIYAKQTLDAYSQLISQDFVSKINIYQYQQNLSLAKAAIAADIANIKLAELNMEYTRITAPIDGVIGFFAVQQGNWVNAGSQNATVTSLMQVTPIYAMYAMPETEMAELKRYQNKGPLKVIATLLEHPDQILIGEVFAFNNTVDPTTGTLMVKATFPNKDIKGWPGQFVRVKTQLYVIENAIVVPNTAVQTGQTGPFIYVVLPNSTVEARPVVQGEYLGDKIVIKSGIEVGELVVTDGQLNLYPGAPVSPKEQLPTAEGSIT